MRSEVLGVLFGHAAIMLCLGHHNNPGLTAYNIAKAAHDWLVNLGTTIVWLKYVGVKFSADFDYDHIANEYDFVATVGILQNLFSANNIPHFAHIELVWRLDEYICKWEGLLLGRKSTQVF